MNYGLFSIQIVIDETAREVPEKQREDTQNVKFFLS